VGTKQQAITRKAKEVLNGLCGRRFTWSRNLEIRHHNRQTTCITPGDSRRQKSMEGVGGGIDGWNQLRDDILILTLSLICIVDVPVDG